MSRLALKNGKIYVERGVFAQAVLMENGRVTAVGSNEDIDALAGDVRVIDCGGRTVIPGLNDSHLHLIQIGTRLSRAEIAGSSSIDDMVQRVKAFMERTGATPDIIASHGHTIFHQPLVFVCVFRGGFL